VKNTQPEYYNDLDKIYLKIWNLLTLGLEKRDSPYHIPVFICSNNEFFDGRIIVLRGVSEQDKKIWFHSDIRSNKIRALKLNPKATLLFYDKTEKIQLRISCKIIINYQNDITESSWQKNAHMSRQCYLGENAPGAEIASASSGLTSDVDNFKYTIKESEKGYKNFCVIENFIESIEWLYLAAKGHRRAYFCLKNNSLEKKWLIP